MFIYLEFELLLLSLHDIVYKLSLMTYSVLFAGEFTSTSLVNGHTSLSELRMSPNFAFIVIHTVLVPLVLLNGFKRECWVLTYNMHGFNFMYFW